MLKPVEILVLGFYESIISGGNQGLTVDDKIFFFFFLTLNGVKFVFFFFKPNL